MIADLLLIIFGALLAAGAALIYVPAGLITAGVLGLAGVILYVRPGPGPSA